MSFITRVKAITRTVSHFLGEGIWNIDLAGLSPKRGKLYKHLKIILITHRHFQSLRCGREAVALSFFTTMATVPLLAVILLIAGNFGLLDLLTRIISGLFVNNPSMGEMVMGWANNIVDMTSGGGFGLVSSLTFLWLVLWMMLCVENSFNHIWDVGKSANFFRRIIVYISILILSPFVLVMFFYGVTYFFRFIGFLGGSKLVGFVNSYLFWVIFYALSVLVISLMYKFIPHAKVKYSACFKAALVSALGFLVIQYLYLETQIVVTRLNAVYGAVAAIPLYMMWLNLCWFDILFGVDLSYAYQHVNEYDPEIDRRR
ncbi:MAG: YihY/virulence factor BrkB family protein [Bacteroidales bacterium]|nr:YihY/virulence factor BrkB family protein [Bacteroidales bacterium]